MMSRTGLRAEIVNKVDVGENGLTLGHFLQLGEHLLAFFVPD